MQIERTEELPSNRNKIWSTTFKSTTASKKLQRGESGCSNRVRVFESQDLRKSRLICKLLHLFALVVSAEHTFFFCHVIDLFSLLPPLFPFPESFSPCLFQLSSLLHYSFFIIFLPLRFFSFLPFMTFKINTSAYRFKSSNCLVDLGVFSPLSVFKLSIDSSPFYNLKPRLGPRTALEPMTLFSQAVSNSWLMILFC